MKLIIIKEVIGWIESQVIQLKDDVANTWGRNKDLEKMKEKPRDSEQYN